MLSNPLNLLPLRHLWGDKQFGQCSIEPGELGGKPLDVIVSMLPQLVFTDVTQPERRLGQAYAADMSGAAAQRIERGTEAGAVSLCSGATDRLHDRLRLVAEVRN